MKLQRVALNLLRASAQPRQLITSDVDKLAASIKDVGLINPITVRPAAIMSGIATQGFQIVAGHHRVAACRTLGWDEIDAVVVDIAEHLGAELIEIDENLCRSELTAAQRSKAVNRRREIWEALHPFKPQRFESVFDALGTAEGRMTEAAEHEESGAACATLEKPTTGRGNTQFAAETAAVTGESKSQINRHLARAEALGDDLEKVTGTSLDKGVELDALKAMPPEQRAPLIERAQAGECVSARDAAKQTSPALMVTPSIRLQMALMQGIARVLESAGVKTAEELVAQIMALPVRERDFLANQLDVFEYVGCLGSNRRGE